MVPKIEYPARSKEIAIWALAQQDPDFAAFYARYQEEITLNAPLSDEFLDGVIAVVEEAPALAPIAKCCLENAQWGATFAVSGLPEVGILIAAIFLLCTYIKIHRTEDGRWEFLLEYPASGNGPLEKVVQVLSDLF